MPLPPWMSASHNSSVSHTTQNGSAHLPATNAKSIALTGWLAGLIERECAQVLEILTPAEPARRGSQLSLRVKGARHDGRALFDHLAGLGIIGDWREPDVIRIAPTALYNRHADGLRFVRAVREWAARQ